MPNNEIFGSGTTPKKGDTLRMLLVKDIKAVLAGGGGGGGSGIGEVHSYTGTDPTSDGITPSNVNGDAICYKLDGTGPTYNWNSNSQTWV